MGPMGCEICRLSPSTWPCCWRGGVGSMSATEFEDTGAPLPRISEIRSLPDFRLAIVWAQGSRTGRADFVDLAPVINTYKLYRPLRNNEGLFQTARLVDHGNVVAWGDGTIDMSSE